MNLALETKIADRYKSRSQKVRVITEHWVGDQVYCPNCGNLSLAKYRNNKPVADFFCANCKEDFELKSGSGKKNSKKIVDGAYETMIERLRGNQNPNLFLLNYNPETWRVVNFLVIPKHFFVVDIIEKRKPLSPTARRAGWTGCNILLQKIPQTGKIFVIKKEIIEPKNKVLSQWKKTLFLRKKKDLGEKGWLVDVLGVIERIGSREFLLSDVYKFEQFLSEKHPRNHHIKAKIRQQLQFLRDENYLEFIEKGKYRLKS